MAITTPLGNVADQAVSRGGFATSPEKYTTVEELLTGNAPDVKDQLAKIYGDQGITGFLKMTGAVRAGGSADFVEWYEEGRRHTKFVTAATTVTASDVDGIKGLHCVAVSVDGVANTAPETYLNVGDVVLSHATGLVYIVNLLNIAIDGSSADADGFILSRMDGTDASSAMEGETQSWALIGNTHAQGSTTSLSAYKQHGLNRLRNSYNIVKDLYQVNGSQATNVGYVNVGNGDYRWYIKGEQETRNRFVDKREMMMLFSEKANQNDQGVSTIGTLPGDVAGSEGYFAAVAARGITATSDGSSRIFDSMADIDNVLLELDKEGAPAEYAMYIDRRTSLDIDDMLANGIATQSTAGLAGQFGAFNNDADMAVKLGFKSFTRGGYTFHKHDWKLLNDPTLIGGMTAAEYRGAMIPLASYVDPQSGNKAPSLEMIYKESNGYSRELEHWVTGGAVIGNKTDDSDIAKFHYRSECQLVTRAANQHVILRGA